MHPDTSTPLSTSFPNVTADTMTKALARIQRDWANEHNDFTNGDCHTLAVALYQAMGREGTLLACLRDSFDEDGQLFSTGYSHMVYQPPNGNDCWDIGGTGADVRWEDLFDLSEEPDRHGLVDRFRWVTVPYDTYQVWLQEHYGCIDNMLTDKLTQALRAQLSTATPTTEELAPSRNF